MHMCANDLEYQSDMPDENEFCLYQNLIHKELGISLPMQKRAMVGHRLSKRLRYLGMSSYREYYAYITSVHHQDEKQEALELITTNETYFFRESKHFEFLENKILPSHPTGRPFRVWSAACSSGEEPYSIAMMLQEKCLANWSILASDVNYKVLDCARKGIYLDSRMSELPVSYRKKYCRKGQNKYEGHLRVIPELRTRVQFKRINLLDSLDDLGKFELIFLRNVLIYFDERLKREIIIKASKHLVPGGYLFIGHSESFHGIDRRLKSIQPAVMQYNVEEAS